VTESNRGGFSKKVDALSGGKHMPQFIIPVHILYNDPGLEREIIHQIKQMASSFPVSAEMPVRISFLRMGMGLDGLTSPSDIDKKVNLNNGLIYYRVDLAGAFEIVNQDYENIRKKGLTLLAPQVRIFLNAQPTNELYWQETMKKLTNIGNAFIGLYWMHKGTAEASKNEIEKEISTHFPARSENFDYKILPYPKSVSDEEKAKRLKEKFDLLRKRITDVINTQKNLEAAPTAVFAHTPANKLGVTPPISSQANKQINGQDSTQDTLVTLQNDAGKTVQGQQGAEQRVSSGDTISTTPGLPQNGEESQSLKSEQQDQLEAVQPPAATVIEPASNSAPKAPPPPPAPAVWKILEPDKNLGDRYAHFYTNSLDYYNWFMVAASRRGKLHENEGTFREDAVRIRAEAGWLLIAVADGAGSHHLSRVGSNHAVTRAVDIMTTTVKGQSPSSLVAKVALQEALQEAWKALYYEAEKRKENKVQFRDLSTTLLLLMYHPKNNLVGFAQVGDGLIAAQLENDQIAVLGNPESGEYAGQTYFLTNYKIPDLAAKVQTPEAPGKVKLFFVMTDGVGDDIYPPASRLAGLIKPIPGVISAPEPEKALLELINYNRPGSFDDRTLVVACRKDLYQEPGPTTVKNELAQTPPVEQTPAVGQPEAVQKAEDVSTSKPVDSGLVVVPVDQPSTAQPEQSEKTAPERVNSLPEQANSPETSMPEPTGALDTSVPEKTGTPEARMPEETGAPEITVPEHTGATENLFSTKEEKA
jgi:hypothetical protein